MARSVDDAGSQARALFAAHTALRAVIGASFDNGLGTLTVDDPEHPTAARIDIGCYAFFGGTATADRVASLLEGLADGIELIVPDDQGWRDLLLGTFGPRLRDRPMRTFLADQLDRAHLATIAAEIPAGIEIGAMDATLIDRLDEGLVPHAMEVFDSAERFMEVGFGYGAIDGGRLVSASTTYAVSRERVEVAVSTRPSHRGRGLARVVAAATAGRSLDLGLVPDWTASDPVSQRIARSLGYRPGPLCDALVVGRPTRQR